MGAVVARRTRGHTASACGSPRPLRARVLVHPHRVQGCDAARHRVTEPTLGTSPRHRGCRFAPGGAHAFVAPSILFFDIRLTRRSTPRISAEPSHRSVEKTDPPSLTTSSVRQIAASSACSGSCAPGGCASRGGRGGRRGAETADARSRYLARNSRPASKLRAPSAAVCVPRGAGIGAIERRRFHRRYDLSLHADSGHGLGGGVQSDQSRLERFDGHGRLRTRGLQHLRRAKLEVDVPEAGAGQDHLWRMFSNALYDVDHGPDRLDDVLLFGGGGGQGG